MIIRSMLGRLRDLVLRPVTVSQLEREGLVVGRNFHLLRGAWLDRDHIWHIVIGDDVTLAPGVRVLAHDASTKIHLDYTRVGKVLIGDRVFVGADSIILPGVSIGDDVAVGAGSVVSRDIPSDSVAVGNPARVIGSLKAFLARRREEMEVHPRFSEAYTVRGGITEAQKQEMNAAMHKRIGYVV